MISMVIGVIASLLIAVGTVTTVASPMVLLDAPAVMLVVALALFSTLGVSGKLSRPALIRHFGHAAVRAGWIGFLIGIVLILTMADPSSPDFLEYLMRAAAVAVLTPLYGYGLDFLTRIISPQN